MPYFVWQGIDLLGNTRHGKSFARTQAELDQLLFKRQIALLKSSEARDWVLFQSITLSHKIHFFRQLSELMSSGVLLPEALRIVADQTENSKLRKVAHAIGVSVLEGVTLSEALNQYSVLFDNLVLQVVAVGQESGALALALDTLADYLQSTDNFHKRVKDAAMMPAVTFVFFIIIAIAIFVVIIPTFATMFLSMKKELPAITRTMLKLSAWIRRYGFIGIFGFVAIYFGIKKHRTTRRGALFFDALYLRIPLINTLLIQTQLTHFLQAVSMLLAGGLPLVPSLKLSRHTVRNSLLNLTIQEITYEVESGVALSDAMMQDPDQLFGLEAQALIKVGEESGKLAEMMSKASILYENNVKRQLAFITTMVQPLLVVILGLLITGLIFSVYLPVLTLSHIM